MDIGTQRARIAGTVILAHKEINSRKADRLPEEAGLRLRRQPSVPREYSASILIRNGHRERDWKHFPRVSHLRFAGGKHAEKTRLIARPVFTLSSTLSN